jgi:S1-C subfamily serine protease
VEPSLESDGEAGDRRITRPIVRGHRDIFYPWSDEFNLPLVARLDGGTAGDLLERAGVLWAERSRDGYGVVVRDVAPSLGAADAGLRAGDVIIMVGFAERGGGETLRHVGNVQELFTVAIPSGDALVVRYMRLGKQRGTAISVWIRTG